MLVKIVIFDAIRQQSFHLKIPSLKYLKKLTLWIIIVNLQIISSLVKCLNFQCHFHSSAYLRTIAYVVKYFAKLSTSTYLQWKKFDDKSYHPKMWQLSRAAPWATARYSISRMRLSCITNHKENVSEIYIVCVELG